MKKNHSISRDDPRLTAYALGDLARGEERDRIEVAVNASPELQTLVAEIRALATILTREFENESLPIEEEVVPSSAITRSPWRYAAPLGLAACLALSLTWFFQRFADRDSRSEIVAHPSAVHETEAGGGLATAPVPAPGPVNSPAEPSLQPSPSADPTVPKSAVASAERGEFESRADHSLLSAPDGEGRQVSGSGMEVPPIEIASVMDNASPSPDDITAFSLDLAQASREQVETVEATADNADLFGASFGSGPVRGSDEDSLTTSAPGPITGWGGKLQEPDPDPLASRASPERRATGVDSARMASIDPANRGTATKEIDPLSKRKAAPRPRVANTESYASTPENPFKKITQPGDELTTFSTDVDTASYANVRRFLTNGQLPPQDAVRVEEMINYFHYDYSDPGDDEHPFSVNLEVNEAPWAPGHRLLRIGLKARDVMVDDRPDSNLVFLIDVSGSMSPYNKLPLLKQVLHAMAPGLTERDRVSMVVYAGESRVHLHPTPGNETQRILSAIQQLKSGGSTNGESGIQLAYELAGRHRIVNGVNRVLLATDGDFNVGTTDTQQLITMARARAKEDHIFLTVLGLGEGNLKDDRMEQLADNVDGTYHYIDSEREGRKILIDEMSATLVPIAKDVKVQVEFNPAKVKSYSLIGYANRLLANRDFTDDSKDAGEMGAGHRVTAFYEIVPAEHRGLEPDTPLKYRPADQPIQEERRPDTVLSEDLVTVRLRYKDPQAETSQLIETALVDRGTRWAQASEDFRFAASVAAFGQRLRGGRHCQAPFDEIRQWADAARTRDEYGWRAEFIELIRHAERCQPTGNAQP